MDIKLPTIITTSTSPYSQFIATTARLGFADAILSLFELLVSQGAANIDQVVANAAVVKTGLRVLPPSFLLTESM